ncbi:MAG TPA: UDP-2,3-diacylglucosamine diphosphatase [Burkholderiaceae bacterium]|nr:UDP-2,3-diacylglucosamine diphosphatase [Burkholderiaceae bacterium]
MSRFRDDATDAARAPAAAAPRRASDGDDEAQVERYRAIFISDIHLGTAGCKAAHLLDFLRHNESQTLYLVGDIIDGWAMRGRFFWHQTHNDVIQKILRKARKGTRVIYIPGNHDEAAHPYCGLDFGDIEIRADAVHELADGRRMWVVHGDLADGVIRHAKWLAHVGDWLYEFLLWLNRHVNAVRARLGFGYWSLSQYLKLKVKNAVSFISDFEAVLAREARRRGYQGVICGHIHHAEIREVAGMLYCNDGDWVESLTALVETLEGELRIVTWNTILAPGVPVLRWNDADPVQAAGPAAIPAATAAATPSPELALR